MVVESGRSAVGSAPRSGRGGRWFESSRPDFRLLRNYYLIPTSLPKFLCQSVGLL